jgi:hypothetical protein
MNFKTFNIVIILFIKRKIALIFRKILLKGNYGAELGVVNQQSGLNPPRGDDPEDTRVAAQHNRHSIQPG